MKRKDIKDEQDFYAYLSENKQFIMQRLMKLFYYWNYNESDGLGSDGWTKVHWMTEIVDILDINKLPIDDENLTVKELHDSLSIKPNYETCSKYLKDLMAKDWKWQNHKLPVISEWRLKNKWNAFVSAYSIFISRICNRLAYTKNRISREMIYNYWVSMAMKCSRSEKVMRKVSEKYSNFSELTDRLKALLENKVE